MTKGINLKLSVNVINRKHILLNLVLENYSSKDYFFDKNVLLLNGFTSNHINISGPSEIRCAISHGIRDSGAFFLEHGQYKENSLLLNRLCSFKKAVPGRYKIEYSTYIHPCTDQDNCDIPKKILGDTYFDLGEF